MKSILEKSKKAIKFETTKENLIVYLADGSFVVFRKTDYPYLKDLSTKQLSEFKIMGFGTTLFNEKLDIYLSIEYLIQAHGVIKSQKKAS